LVQGRRGANDAAIFDQQIHVFPCFHQTQLASLPATMLIAAMRTAMPKVTCGKITD